ncbi:1968_t:CDS:10 [Funneliformis geosporum]|uniref:1968_t:CDS:1 n=1 Tax=Funneliformis geosporum TaxID=1117311 RepID=A0A9W4WJ74_9GLOM|nr:1968_t:CDS:10 [Funneliformis geosporum]
MPDIVLSLARLRKRRRFLQTLKKWVPIVCCWNMLAIYSSIGTISQKHIYIRKCSTPRPAVTFRDDISQMSNFSSIKRAVYIEKGLRKAGLKTEVQNFTVNISGKKISGTNVYGLIKAPRADGTEALVLSAPWKSRDGKTININGIAAALSLGKFFKGYTYWSKDIIILITDGGEAGVQAWLESYHDLPRSGILSTPLLLRSEGVNGQLPNLDLINTVVRVCRMSNNIPIMLHDSGHHYLYDNGNYYASFHNLLQAMKYQALGHPTGSHGLFFRYKIDAITLYGHTSAPTSTSFKLWGKTGNIIESSPEDDRSKSSSSNENVHVVPLPYNDRPRQILFPMTVLIVTHFTGLLIFFIIINHSSISQMTEIFGMQGFLFTLSLTTSLSIIVPTSLIKVSQVRPSNNIIPPSRQKPAPNWIILKSFTLAFTAMIISCLSVLNFNLAVFISLMVIIPFSLFQPTPKYQILQYLQLLVLIIISPPGILLSSRTNMEEFLRWVLMEYELFGSYLLPFICCFYWPNILVYGVIVFSENTS